MIFIPTDNLLCSGHCIYVRSSGALNDRQLLNEFGLSSYVAARDLPAHRRHALIASDGSWTVLADDWWYTVWNDGLNPETAPNNNSDWSEALRKTLEQLAQSFDVFATFIADADCSYSFRLYLDGRLRRHLCEEYRGPSLTVDYGVRLPGERKPSPHGYGIPEMAALAESLGIKCRYKRDDVRIYVPVGTDVPQPNFD